MRHRQLVRWSAWNLVKMLSAPLGSGLPACEPDCRKSLRTSQSSVLNSSLRRPHLHGGRRVPASSPYAQPAARPYPYPGSPSPWRDEPKLHSELVGTVRAPARGPGVSSWRGIQARRFLAGLVGVAGAGVGTDAVPDGLLPRSRRCSLVSRSKGGYGGWVDTGWVKKIMYLS
jgi:hypothetical protein